MIQLNSKNCADPCPDLNIIENFYSPEESNRLFNRLLQEQNWPDNRYFVAGREFVLPRQQTWHADPGIVYSYSNNLLKTRPWTPLLSALRSKVEGYLQFTFNAVLVNLYRNGEDYVGWHSDNEAEMGDHPFIASLTFGAERQFSFRHKKTAETRHIALPNGSLLIMQPAFQHQWLHSLPKDRNIDQGRINLTFRHVIAKKESSGR